MQWNLSDLTAFFEEMPKECHSSLATLKHHVEDCGCLQEKETRSKKCNLIQALSKGNFWLSMTGLKVYAFFVIMVSYICIVLFPFQAL